MEKRTLTPEQIEKKIQQIRTLTNVITQKCQEYKQIEGQSLFDELKQEWASDDYINDLVYRAFKGREVEIDALTYAEKIRNARNAVEAFCFPSKD